MLEPEEVKFDKIGQWLHSAFIDEDLDDTPFVDYKCSAGMEFRFKCLEEDKWNPDGPTDLSRWAPIPPEGDGWFLVALTEGEDGPFAAFARPTSSEIIIAGYDTLQKIVDQLARCDYEAIGGPLKNNVAFIALTRMAAKPLDMLIFCPSCGKQHIDQPEPDICECGHSKAIHQLGYFDNEYSACDGLDGEDATRQCRCRGFKIAWDNPPHKSHKCHTCGTTWRPADVPTNGVAQIKTIGKDDSWILECPKAREAAELERKCKGLPYMPGARSDAEIIP